MLSSLTRELRIACAGAGKSTWIISEATKLAKEGMPCLIVTYTEENQIELKRKLANKYGKIEGKVDVKGWFSFLLEDMIRPYQNHILARRIQNVCFNENNPHQIKTKKGKTQTIPGTAESKNLIRHYTTGGGQLAHTFFISKLAMRVFAESNKASVDRLSRIYGGIFFDEVQDLVGWDYEVLSALSKSNLPAVHAVGDFRQTIYKTAFGTKKPQSDSEKKEKFTQMNFETISMTGSYRCCQAICDVANLVYPSGHYEDTVSVVDVARYPLPSHSGVFTVARDKLAEYVSAFKPAVLRRNKNINVECCRELEAFTFGKAKGKQFNNILIVPTDPQKVFFLGDRTQLDKGKTDMSKAQFYVALTRARHSVAILMDEKSVIDGVETYNG